MAKPRQRSLGRFRALAERMGTRGVIFAALVAGCLAFTAGYVTWAAVRDDSGRYAAVRGPVAIDGTPASLAQMDGAASRLMFQSIIAGDHWAQVGLVPLSAPDGARSMMPLKCLRVHFSANQGICLASDDGGTDFAAYLFGPEFQVHHKVRLGGMPSRTRVSSDGRFGATTVFVAGHSYADNSFSTETLLIDLANGASLGNLEEFTVERDSEPFSSIDFNYWGVTFAQDSNRFYATLATGGKTYLVEGNVAARQMRVLRENVECPALSPDNTRLAFKKRIDDGLGGVEWRFHVLDLATMTETPLAETRSIDDQIEWLDDGQVLYGESSDLWTVPADGSGEPQVFMKRALSPAVVSTASLSSRSTIDSSTDTVTVDSTDMAVTMSATPDQIQPGDALTYTVTATNQGPADATGIVVDIALPPDVFLEGSPSVAPVGISYGCSADGERGTIRCDTPSLPTGESWTITMTVTVESATTGSISSEAMISTAQRDPRPENDHASAETSVAATE